MRQGFVRNLSFDGIFYFENISGNIYHKKEFQQFSISHEIQNHQVDPLYLEISIENLNHCHDNQMMDGGNPKDIPHITLYTSWLRLTCMIMRTIYLITRKASKMFFININSKGNLAKCSFNAFKNQ